MTKVYLVRHAEAEGNLYRRAQGQYNSTITDRGYRQIAALAERFKKIKIDAVYASDLWRTRTTALSVCMPHELPLNLAPEFREVRMGVWEDHTWAWIEHTNAAGLKCFNTDAQNWQIEGGETLLEVRDRAYAKLKELVKAHDGETIAIFSHGMCLRMLVGHLQGLTTAEIDKTHHAENTAVTYLEAEGGRSASCIATTPRTSPTRSARSRGRPGSRRKTALRAASILKKPTSRAHLPSSSKTKRSAR